ncbi:MAG: R3H domain-containing nucleic acid-binding protein, partial [Dolichospermum sp.]
PKHSLPTPSRNELQDLGKEKALSSWAGKECFKVYLYAITRSFVDNVLQRLQLEQQVVITQQLHEADVVLALRGHARPGAKILRMAQDYELPVFYAKTNTLPQIQKTLRESFENTQKGEVLLACLADMAEQQSPLLAWTDSLEALESSNPETELALNEALEAVEQVKKTQEAYSLSPRRSYIRRLQYELVEKEGFKAISVGAEPDRHLKILPKH